MTLIFTDQSFNPAAKITARHFGNEAQPLVIIDNVLKYPEQLVTFADEASEFSTPTERSYYPGKNGKLPHSYGPALVTALRPLLASVFGLPADKSLSFDGFFGLATASEAELVPLQKIPHFDSSNPFRLAIIHYLCAPPFQGTGLFRHRATGFESITKPRLITYRSKVDAELDSDGRASSTQALTHNYEQIDVVDAAFNRLAIYRTTSLHAGLLSGGHLSSDPKLGRLTANGFIEIYPR